MIKIFVTSASKGLFYIWIDSTWTTLMASTFKSTDLKSTIKVGKFFQDVIWTCWLGRHVPQSVCKLPSFLGLLRPFLPDDYHILTSSWRPFGPAWLRVSRPSGAQNVGPICIWWKHWSSGVYVQPNPQSISLFSSSIVYECIRHRCIVHGCIVHG